MRITVWNDYICPWAYAARPQTAWLRRQVDGDGRPVDVRVRSFELHPDLPTEGRPTRPGGRLDRVLDHIAGECAARGQPFVKPVRTPNSRRVLSLAELVARRHPDSFDRFDEAAAQAHWVDGRDLGDDAVLASLLESVGVERSLLDDVDRAGAELLAAARTDAMDIGATATPSWQIGDLVVTGLHDDAQFHRWVERILARPG